MFNSTTNDGESISSILEEEIARISRPQSRAGAAGTLDFPGVGVHPSQSPLISTQGPGTAWGAAQSSLLSQLTELNPPLRAATAPPPRLNDASFQHHLDIRLDEDYERFYRAQLASGNSKVPPPLGERTLYSDLAPGFDSSELEGILGLDVDAGRERTKASTSILQSLSQMNLAGDGQDGALSGRASPAIGNSRSYPNLGGMAGNVSAGNATQQPLPTVPSGLHPQSPHTQPSHQQYQRNNQGYYSGNDSDSQYQAAYQAAYQALLAQHHQMLQVQQNAYNGMIGPGGLPQIPQHLQAAMLQAMNAQAMSQQMGQMNSMNPMNPMNPMMGMNPMNVQQSHHTQAAAAAAAAVSMMSQQRQPQQHAQHQAQHQGQQHNQQHQGGGRGQSSNANSALRHQKNRNHSRSSGRLASMAKNGNASNGRLNELGREGSRPLGGSGASDDDLSGHGNSHGSGGSKYEKLSDLKGRVSEAAKDQAGCRFLQKKFDEGGPASIEVVFSEILADILDLMMDPFGNYLIQKLLDRCSEEQRLEVLKASSKDGGLISASLNTHGTRAVQKLIETLTTREQTQLVVESLSPGVVKLIRDLNGNHVIQRCLQRLNPTEAQFIYDAASENCLDIATHRHGCCVLQRCIDHSTATQRRLIISKVSVHSLPLSQDPFGNYVVQYILELGQTESSTLVMRHLKGNYADLAVQKFASNVVEKCLKLGGSGLNEAREEVVKELMVAPNLSQLLQDPYANYVMQSALSVSSGQVHSDLVEAIRPHLPVLRASSHGKRILAKIQSTS